jgi:hypothetical protein
MGIVNEAEDTCLRMSAPQARVDLVAPTNQKAREKEPKMIII